jgi:flavodoxin
MHIGIIVYSQTGNTYSVAQKLEESLAAAGHTVTLERLQPVGESKPGDKDVQFEALPDTEPYDALAFGAWVEAFSLTSAMASYFEQVASLQGKPVACFVTKQLPFYWTGGNRAIRQMKKFCTSKGANVLGSGIVIWGSKQRNQQINQVVDRLTHLFGQD